MKLQRSIGLSTVTMAVSAFVCLSSAGMAAEKVAIDPTGIWKIVSINTEANAKGIERTLKLKLEGGKLVGTISSQSNVNGKRTSSERVLKEAKLQGTAFRL